jgi:hypothetical protein
MTRPAKWRQRGEFAVHFEYHIAPLAAIAAIRPTSRHVFLPSEMYDSIPTAPGGDKDFRLVKKHFVPFPTFNAWLDYTLRPGTRLTARSTEMGL